MNSRKKLSIFLLTIFFPTFIPTLVLASNSNGFWYEKMNNNNQIIHIVKINPNIYKAQIVKANNGKGRETVKNMALRHKADIAINGGFFDIGGDNDGRPSRTLIINDKIYKMRNVVEPLVIINSGKVLVNLTKAKDIHLNKTSVLSGIPMLINNGKIVENIKDKNSSFYTKPHARTAIGVDNLGNIIIVVAENFYSNDLMMLAISEMTNDFNSGFKTKGLSILELANLMLELNCKYALNLDGGGSSSLFINGKIINTTIGDEDEAAGKNILRPVSDAIIFKRLN